MSEKLANYLRTTFPKDFTEDVDPVDLAIKLLDSIAPAVETVQQFKFFGSVLFNKGLGDNVFNIPEIITTTPAEAQKIAEEIGRKKYGDKMKEVRIRPIGPA